MEGGCKLCLHNKKLQKKSHIIPNSMFRNITDGNGQITSISRDDVIKGRQGRKLPPEYDKFIMCYECEQKVLNNRYENYSNNILSGDNLRASNSPYTFNLRSPLVHWNNVNYHSFKLFILSIVWRMSISSRPFYQEVSLDFYIQERLRRMIIQENPGEVFDFPFEVYSMAGDRSLPDDVVIKPFSGFSNIENVHIVVFSFYGFLFLLHLKIDDHNVSNNVLFRTIKKSNTLYIEKMPYGAKVFIARFNLGL